MQKLGNVPNVHNRGLITGLLQGRTTEDTQKKEADLFAFSWKDVSCISIKEKKHVTRRTLRTTLPYFCF